MIFSIKIYSVFDIILSSLLEVLRNYSEIILVTCTICYVEWCVGSLCAVSVVRISYVTLIMLLCK